MSKNIQKVISLILVLALSVTMLAACGKTKEEVPTESASPTGEATETTEATASTGNTPADDLNTLTVGTPDMNGDFIEGFGNSSYDLYIKNLLHGYVGTYATTPSAKFVLNDKVVKSEEVSLDEEGNKTYKFVLHEDWKWSDGTPITAKDYVSDILFRTSPEWVVAGASQDVYTTLVGYGDYHKGYKTDTDGLAVDKDGKTIEKVTGEDEEGNPTTNIEELKAAGSIVPVKVFEGVKLLGDYEFSVTISATELPYFYEPSYATVGPLYMPNYVPEADIISDENGSSFTEGYDLQTAANNIAEKERFFPTVTCGPYKFVSFENQIVTLVINENFKCDYEGNRPTITNIVQKSVPSNTDIDALLAGDIDMLTGVVEGAKIEKAKASDVAQLHSYLRAGYGYLGMHCDWGVTKDVNVRQAIGAMIDRQAVIDYVLGGYGGTVDSLYGLAQWMCQERSEEIDEKIEPISFNLKTANDFLDKSDYKFEADGKTPFDVAKVTADGTYLRHDAKGNPLVIKHLGTQENAVTDIIEIQYTANAPQCGVKFEVTKSDFNALLQNYYYGFDQGDERTYNTFNLAVGFPVVDDPYYNWHSDFVGTWKNSAQLNDPEVDRLTEKMRRLDASQTEEYADAWVELMVRFREVLPQVPLYSNEYFDLSYKTVDGLATTPYSSWSMMICTLSKSAK